MKKFPVVNAKGSHYEVGKAVGMARRDAIVNLFNKNLSLYPDFFRRFKQESRKLFRHTQQVFPQYIDELRGQADGAGLDVEDLFLSNAHEIQLFANSPKADHCTIIAIPSNDGYIVGHNEDWEASAQDHLFILDAQVEGVRIFGLGYDFANTIIGDSIAINQYGLLQEINDVSHQDAQWGVPRGFVARAILDCTSLEEAETMIKTIPRRSGFNHFLVQNNRLWNIESSAKEYVIDKFEGKKYLHTNHYLTQLSRIDRGNNESHARYVKVKKLMPGINSVEDLKRVLSDREYPQICRPGTIGSVIFDMSKNTVFLTYGQPNTGSYYKLRYNL